MALNPSNSSNLEQLALKGLSTHLTHVNKLCYGQWRCLLCDCRTMFTAVLCRHGYRTLRWINSSLHSDSCLMTYITHRSRPFSLCCCISHSLLTVMQRNTTADKTTLVCLVSTEFPISTFSVILNIFETEQLQIGNWVETRQNCLVLSPVVFTPPTRTKQGSFVLSVSVV